MDEAMIVLGKRALACKGWRWMPGMLIGEPGSYSDGRMLIVGEEGPLLWEYKEWLRGPRSDSGGAWWHGVPNFSDPATVGCLLALVREVRKNPGIYAYAVYSNETGLIVGWQVEDGRDNIIGRGATEAEALVAALEGAP